MLLRVSAKSQGRRLIGVTPWYGSPRIYSLPTGHYLFEFRGHRDDLLGAIPWGPDSEWMGPKVYLSISGGQGGEATSGVENPLWLRFPCIYEIEILCCRFFWGENEGEKRLHTINWRPLCLPVKSSGLGFPNMQLLNHALLAKIAWG